MIVSTTLLLLILLPIFASLLLSLPVVQNKLIYVASEYASQYLDTEVSLRHIDVTTMGNIEIQDVLVRDLQGDTLIFASQLDTRLLGYSIFDRNIKLGRTKFHNGLLNLQEREDGEMNIRQIAKLLTNPERENNIRIDITRVDIEQTKVIIERKVHRPKEYGIDYGNMILIDLSARCDMVEIQGNDITASIKYFSAIEQSGFVLSDLSGELRVSTGEIELNNLSLSSRWSALKITKLLISDDSWEQYRNFINSTSMYIDIEGGYVSSDDVAYFSPELQRWGLQLNDLSMEVAGCVDDLEVNIRNLSYGDSTYMAANINLEGLPDINQTHISVDVDRLSSNVTDIEALNFIFSNRDFEPQIYKTIAAAGNIELIGDIQGVMGDVAANLQTSSSLGIISAADVKISWLQANSSNIQVGDSDNKEEEENEENEEGKENEEGHKTTDKLKIEGNITLNEVPLQQITPHGSQLGSVNLQANISGRIDQMNNINMDIASSIGAITWRDYTYQNIYVAGRFDSNDLRATISSYDPNLTFGLIASIEGVDITKGESVKLNENTKSAISLNLMHADLAALGFSKDRDTNNRRSTLTTDMSITIEGDNIERATGEANIRQMSFASGDNIIKTDSASLRFESKTGERSVKLESDFATVTFDSRDSVSHIIDYINDLLKPYLPALYKESIVERADNDIYTQKFSSAITMAMTVQDESNESVNSYDETQDNHESQTTNDSSPKQHAPSEVSHLNVDIIDIEPILNIIAKDIKINQGSSLHVEFDTHKKLFSGTLKSGYIERKTTLAIGIEVGIYNNADSVILSGGVDDLFIGTLNMNNTRINASAFDNKVMLHGRFDNIDSTSFADINAEMILSRKRVGRQDIQELEIKLYPSQIRDQRQLWDMSAKTIDIRHAGIDVDQFMVESGDQRLVIDGRASTSAADTIDMTMQRFDLSVLTTFISQLGYQLEGETTGHIGIASALDNASIEASVKLDNVNVNTIPTPPMELSATWDSKMNRARLTVTNRNNNNLLLRGYYIPSQVSYYANLQAEGVDMSLLDPPLNGVTKQTTGDANIELTLQGERRNATIEGRIDIINCETTIDFTNARYYIPKATLTVKDNLISGQKIAVNDGQNGTGRIGISVNMQHLSNIDYNLTVSLRNMLVLNTTERDNDEFYGILYASGHAEIKGDRSGSKMDIVATSSDDSHFFMQLLSKSSIASADFITFVEPTIEVLDDAAALRRQLLANRNIAQNISNSVAINMSLGVSPNTEVQLVIDPTVGDIIRSRGEGRFDININPAENLFEMYGDYTISEGSYLFTLSNIINKKFVIEPNSTIQWNGSPTDAMLNIDAVYQLKTSIQPLVSTESTRAVPVECIINLSNMLTRPDVAFSIDFPTLDSEQQAVMSTILNDQEVISRQFFYLMLANSFIPESSGIDSSLGVSTTASTGFELLTNQLSNWLSTSNYNIIIRYRPESELTGEEVDIGFSKGLINNRLLLEVEGNYISNGTETLSENGSNLMGEAYLTWLIDRAGALRLRGFTQTIDRYDENQGLQETGIGVSYSESFENFEDLRNRVKVRFSASPERIAQRERQKEKREKEKEERETEKSAKKAAKVDAKRDDD